MAEIHKLTSGQFRSYVTQGKPGAYSDGSGLYLRVTAKDTASWLFRYQRNGKVVQKGLGSTKARGLADARKIAGKMREAVAAGVDPATVLKPQHDPAAMTFKKYAAELIESKKAAHRSGKHHAQWESTLTAYAYPTIGNKRPGEITVADMKAVLNPIWATKTETATRVRQRCEAIIDYANTIEGKPGGMNAARWKGVLSNVLPAPRKVAGKVKHHAAAPYSEVPAIMAKLRDKDCTSAHVLRFSILTAARSGEVRGAMWAEMDLAKAVWSIPAERMKGGLAHNVPLSAEALEILEAMKARKMPDCERVFPGARAGLISDVAVNKTLHGVCPGVTAHGFRSSFRQWGAETTSHPSAVLELALAHVNQNKVEAAYQRSDLFAKRAELMKAWGDYCLGKSNVIEIASHQAKAANG